MIHINIAYFNINGGSDDKYKLLMKKNEIDIFIICEFQQQYKKYINQFNFFLYGYECIYDLKGKCGFIYKLSLKNQINILEFYNDAALDHINFNDRIYSMGLIIEDLLLVVWYNPPYYNDEQTMFNNILKKINKIYNSSNIIKQLLIFGDFNSRNNVWDAYILDSHKHRASVKRGDLLLPIILDNNWKIYNDKYIPTYLQINYKSILDLCLGKGNKYDINLKIENPDELFGLNISSSSS